MAGLLDKRLVVVCGKGGVGRSTVAAALALAAARRGRRTLVAEVAAQDRVAALLGAPPAGFEEVELAPGVFTISIDPSHALDEYLGAKAGPLAQPLVASRMLHGLAAATPGMRELLAIGKAWELAQPRRRTVGSRPYDLVVLDAPATGHALAMLRAPRTFARVARAGPVAGLSRAIAGTLEDPRFTAAVAVARAEEMPVTETLALDAALRAERGCTLAAIVVNALYPERFSARDARAVARAAEQPGNGAPRAALRAALSAHTRAAGQREQLARLRRGAGREPLALPFVFASALERSALERLSAPLEAVL
jgi:hypothetical protein